MTALGTKRRRAQDLTKDWGAAKYEWPGSDWNSGLLTSRQVCFLPHSLKEAERKTFQPWPKGEADEGAKAGWVPRTRAILLLRGEGITAYSWGLLPALTSL